MFDPELSKRIVDGLTRLGYSKGRAEHRVKIYNNATIGSTLYHRKIYYKELDVIMTGSRREGISSFWESDTDRMFVPTNVKCIEVMDLRSHMDQTETILILDFGWAPDGYTFLQLPPSLAKQSVQNILKEDFVLKDGIAYLTNTQNLSKVVRADVDPNTISNSSSTGAEPDSGWIRQHINQYIRRGPSLPFTMPIPIVHKSLKYDSVLALKCSCHYLKSWCERTRRHDWPGIELINTIKGLNAHVVPIGIKGSLDENLQWRISYTLAELLLVHSFNDTQIKVYVVLKMLSKHVLHQAMEKENSDRKEKMQSPSLSYIMKNVVFWISEEVPIEMFTNKLFAARLYHAVAKLRDCLDNNNIPNYMIPSRNLCTEKLTASERSILLEKLNNILEDNLLLVTRLPEIRNEINNTNLQKLDDDARKRTVEEEFLLATFTLPPGELADITHQFLSANNPLQCVRIYKEKVLPRLRQNNTNGCFDYFGNRSDSYILFHLLFYIAVSFVKSRFCFSNDLRFIIIPSIAVLFMCIIIAVIFI